MKNGTRAGLAILGTVRNGGDGLRRTLGVIERLRSRLPSSRCVIVTNDNIDETEECLATMSRSAEIIKLDGLAEAVTERVERICMARNMGLLALRNGNSMPEFTLILDLDGPNAELDSDAILDLMTAKSPAWDGLFANQREAYYDLAALRHPIWCPDDCWAAYKHAERRVSALRSLGLVSRRKFKEQLKEKHVYSKQYRIPPDHPWIPVQSAFGGLGLYRSAAIHQHWYDTGPRNNRSTCEHVGMHMRMVAAGARLFVAPALLNQAPPDHLGPGSGAEFPDHLKTDWGQHADQGVRPRPAT